MFPYQAVHAPMEISSEIVKFEVAALEALVAASVRTLEDDQVKAEQAAYMHFDGGQPGGDADRVFMGEYHVRQEHVPVVLSFVDDHRKQFGHSMNHSLDAIVAIVMASACRDFPHAYEK